MAQFKVDTDVLQTTIQTYSSIIDDIQGAVREAQQAIDLLRSSGWKTNASRAFFDNFDLSWKNSMNDQVKIIKHLRECLLNAKNEYGDLYTEASQLGINL